MALLRSFGSKHSRIPPRGLVVQTIEFTQYVGLSTFAMIGCFPSLSSSLANESRNATGIRRCGCTNDGTVASRVTCYSPSKQLTP